MPSSCTPGGDEDNVHLPGVGYINPLRTSFKRTASFTSTVQIYVDYIGVHKNISVVRSDLLLLSAMSWCVIHNTPSFLRVNVQHTQC